jgi:hypothetical protein
MHFAHRSAKIHGEREDNNYGHYVGITIEAGVFGLIGLGELLAIFT